MPKDQISSTSLEKPIITPPSIPPTKEPRLEKPSIELKPELDLLIEDLSNEDPTRLNIVNRLVKLLLEISKTVGEVAKAKAAQLEVLTKRIEEFVRIQGNVRHFTAADFEFMKNPELQGKAADSLNRLNRNFLDILNGQKGIVDELAKREHYSIQATSQVRDETLEMGKNFLVVLSTIITKMR